MMLFLFNVQLRNKYDDDDDDDGLEDDGTDSTAGKSDRTRSKIVLRDELTRICYAVA